MDLRPFLSLSRCPHCGVADPNLARRGDPFVTSSKRAQSCTAWALYVCASCGGCITACTEPYHVDQDVLMNLLRDHNLKVHAVFPPVPAVHSALPERARRYLSQAVEAIHAPDASVMAAASAVDAMLKAIGFTQGSLYERIEKAKTDGRITAEMATWAHQIRLDANEPRHADLNDPHHDEASARRTVDFATALGEFLFVLPQRVTRGLQQAANPENKKKT